MGPQKWYAHVRSVASWLSSAMQMYEETLDIKVYHLAPKCDKTSWAIMVPVLVANHLITYFRRGLQFYFLPQLAEFENNEHKTILGSSSCKTVETNNFFVSALSLLGLWD